MADTDAAQIGHVRAGFAAVVADVNSVRAAIPATPGDIGAEVEGAAASAQAFAIQRANHTGTQAQSTIVDLVADLSALQSGKADLVGGLVPTSQLPAIALGTQVTVANQAARFALTTNEVQNGDTVVQTDTGIRYLVTDDTQLGVAAGYTALNESGGAVDSVNGYTGVVVLAPADLGIDASLAGPTAAQLRDRSTHTGTQAAGTITGLATVATSGSYNDLLNQPTIPVVGTHDFAAEYNAGIV